MSQEVLPKGQSEETGPDGKNNQPGIYRHPKAKREVITGPGTRGQIQADALIRLGYVRIADVPNRRELAEMQEAQLNKDLEREAQAKEVAAARAAARAEKAAAKVADGKTEEPQA